MARPSTAAVRLLAGEHEPVRVATTADIALNSLQTIDGVAVEAGDRVLVKDQTDKRQNGIYTASVGVWPRSPDARTTRSMQKGMTVHVQQGTANASHVYAFMSYQPEVGEDEIEFGFYLSDDVAGDINNAVNAALETISEAGDEAAQDARDQADRAEAAAQSVVSRAWFKTVPDLLADDNTVIGYAGSGAQFEVVPGDPVTAGGFDYDIAAGDATDYHVENAGGVKLYVLENADAAVYAEAFGVPANPTDARDDLEVVFASAGSIAITGSYLTSAGAVNPDNGASDPEPSAFTFTEAKIIDGKKVGRIEVNAGLKSIFHFAGPAGARIEHPIVRDMIFKQPLSADVAASGLSDDYVALRFEGCKGAIVENVHFPLCETALTFQLTQTVSGYDDRSSKANFSQNVTAERCGFMGLQLFSEQGGRHIGHHFKGLAFDGISKGLAAGIRLAAFDFAFTKNNQILGHVVENFANGLSIQQYSQDNEISLTAIDCTNGAAVTRPATAEAAPKRNRVKVTARGGTYGLYDDGGSNNTWDVNLSGFATRGIEATNGGSTTGIAEDNTYRGTISNPGAGSAVRLVSLANKRSKIDLKLIGTGTTGSDTAFGLICTGPGLSGSVHVTKCQFGVQLAVGADGALLNVKASDCGTALSVAASNCTIICDIDGNVTISGNNNKLVGRVSGTITNTGTGNDLSGLRGAFGYGLVTGTTDANGFITHSHGLGGTPRVVLPSASNNNGWIAKPTTITSTQITFRVWSDDAAPVATQSVTIHYLAAMGGA